MYSMTERVLLGIDIDGVFNPLRMMKLDEPEITMTTVHYLNKILEAVPHCDVLITSSWGNKDNRTTKALCEQGFKYPERIVGSSYDLGGLSTRTAEVVRWMEMDTKYKRITCIDDEPDLYEFTENKYGANKHHTVTVRADIGLDESKAYEVVCKLLGINFRFWS